MMNVVLDTNCLIQILGIRNKYNRIWRAFLEGRFEISISNEILFEYEEILGQKFPLEMARMVIQIILRSPNVRRNNPYYSFRLIEADHDDDKFVDCAIVNDALCVVTEDSHFNVLASTPFPIVDVITLDDFDHLLFPTIKS